jgi:putative ABC transport system permease protein
MMILRLIGESFLFAWNALVNNKLRTLLSLLGVTIGIFSIIFVLSIVDSMEADMKSSFDMIGSDILFVKKWPMGPEDGAEDYEWWKYMRRRPPSMRDMESLQERLETAEALSFSASTQATSEHGNNSLNTTFVNGITYEYRNTIAINLASGRYFTPIECETGKNFAIIGQVVKDQLFGETDPLGKEMTIGGLKVHVIGVFEKEGTSLFGNGFDQVVMLPMEFARRLVPPDNEDSTILIKAKEGVTNKQMREELIAAFREVRGIKPKGDNDFSIIESSMINEIVDSIISVFNVVGLVIGIFAILVGAFSIANIMYVSVSERTNIIGIQKALGAKNYFILTQFLFESVALCVIGGTIGLLFVWLTISILKTVVDFNFLLPISRVVAGLSISVIVGLIAGILPAMKAAKLNPVDAIRSK